MAERTYSDFDLMIEGSEEGGYHARVIDSPSGEATASFDLPFSELELENFMLKVGRPRRGTRRLESPEMEAARAFGTKLFDAVFHDDLKLTLRRSLDEVERRDEGLRIRLRFSDTPELASLPWEFLFNETDDKFLVLSAWTPIVRYLDLTKSIEPLTVTAPLRILVMISSPHDYPGLDVEEEWSRIEVALRPLVETGSVVIDRIEEATLLELQRALRRSDYHIFHFVGHGGFNEQADDGVLVLEDGSNRSRQVAGRDLGTILDDHRSLRLAVLNACEGARAGSGDPFSGVAQSLVRQGIPAVVAMQFEITDDAAIVFAQEFYGAIADGFPVDAGVGEARRAIFGQGNDIEWGTPVVYLRGDGRLFDVLAAPPPQHVADDEEPTAAVVVADAAGAEAAQRQAPQESEPAAPAQEEVVSSAQEDVAPPAQEDVAPPAQEDLAPVAAASIPAAPDRGAAEAPVPALIVPIKRRRRALFGAAALVVLIAAIAAAIFSAGGSPSTTIAADTTQPATTATQATTTQPPATTQPPTTALAAFVLPDDDVIYDQPVEDAVRLLSEAGLVVEEATIGCSNSTEPHFVRRVTVGTDRDDGIIFGKSTDPFDDSAKASVGRGDVVTVWTPTEKPCR